MEDRKGSRRIRLKTQIQFPKRCVFSLLFRKNPDDGQSPKTQYLCVLKTLFKNKDYYNEKWMELAQVHV
jgi:hypothetical protein